MKLLRLHQRKWELHKFPRIYHAVFQGAISFSLEIPFSDANGKLKSSKVLYTDETLTMKSTQKSFLVASYFVIDVVCWSYTL